MTNLEYIKSLDVHKMMEFIHNVSTNCEEITTCKEDCMTCTYSEDWCRYGIGEWLNSERINKENA